MYRGENILLGIILYGIILLMFYRFGGPKMAKNYRNAVLGSDKFTITIRNMNIVWKYEMWDSKILENTNVMFMSMTQDCKEVPH